ncbi:MAG TPA: mechanosensitive ion channel family protein, partial [Candidatus Obscuribacterales bacterium]
LRRIAKPLAQPNGLTNLRVASAIDAESNQPIITVNDEVLMTVTYLDARLNGSNSLTLRATEIVGEVEDALTRYHQERQPDFLWRQLRWMIATLFLTAGLSVALTRLTRSVVMRRRQLRHPPEAVASGAAIDHPPEQTTVNTLRTTLLTKQRVSSLGMVKDFLQVLQIALWAGSGLLVLGFWPYTRWLQGLIIDLMRLPIRFAVIALTTYGVIRLSSIWIDRVFLVFQSKTAANIERSQRLVLRLSTFSQVIKGLAAFAIASIAGLIMLSLLGVQVAPLLAGAGLLGFAISFASQSLIKDIINGFLVLLEDQYGVGDVITVRGLSGFVETMNLRITQLRAADGQLITIPNGQIDTVQNFSKEWSRVDLMVPVSLTADINEALQLVEKIANDLRKDSIWGALILEPPLLLGVDELSHAGAIIRIWIKTQPLKQWDVAREYRRRLKIAFDAADIHIGVPQQVVQVAGADHEPIVPVTSLGYGTPSPPPPPHSPPPAPSHSDGT